MPNQAERTKAAKAQAEKLQAEAAEAKEQVKALTRANQMLVEQMAELTKQISELRTELGASKSGADQGAGSAQLPADAPSPSSRAAQQDQQAAGKGVAPKGADQKTTTGGADPASAAKA